MWGHSGAFVGPSAAAMQHRFCFRVVFSNQVQDIVGNVVFAVAANKEASGLETGHITSLRINKYGSRIVTCVNFNQVAKFLMEKEANLTPTQVMGVPQQSACATCAGVLATS